MHGFIQASNICPIDMKQQQQQQQKVQRCNTADAEEIHFNLFNHTEATTTMIALRKRCLTTLEDGSCEKVGDENRGLKIGANENHKSSHF